MFLRKLLIVSCLTLVTNAEYVLVDDYTVDKFGDMFDFFTDDDPTHGYVNYVDRQTAERTKLLRIVQNKVYIGVDAENRAAIRGRNSVRLHSKANYTHGLFILDLAHMPGSICGSWPAFWLVGKGDDWPKRGEIDIIEGVNTQNTNAVTLHTTNNCRISKIGNFSGIVQTDNCDVNAPEQQQNDGCSIRSSRTDRYGDGFNKVGGGVYATDWSSDAIRVWHFPANQIPSDIQAGQPNPDKWGKPIAAFANTLCNIDDHFKEHEIVFDITFCGDWSGREFDKQCPGKGNCVDWVRENPYEFSETFWSVNSLKVYRETPGGRNFSCRGGPFLVTVFVMIVYFVV